MFIVNLGYLLRYIGINYCYRYHNIITTEYLVPDSILPLYTALLYIAEEFSHMKEEVPPPLVDAHLRTVQEAVKEGMPVDPSYALDKTGIAGTVAEKVERETGF